MIKFYLPAQLVLVCSALLVGCGGSPSDDGTKGLGVKGKVTFDGRPVGELSSASADDDQPNGRATIIFSKQGGNEVYTTSISNGQYEFLPNQGIQPGIYRVEIHWSQPTGKLVRDRDSGSIEPGFQDLIPAKYNKNTTLNADVSASKTTFDFTLDK